MRFNYLKDSLKTAVLVATVLLLGAGLTVAQQQVNLTAAPTTVTLPDGSTVPMWGYNCTALAAGVTSTATCAALNTYAPLATATTPAGWSPVVITVPTGATGGLTINLTNNLSFTPTGATTANTVPTSLMIVGQVGGGLGSGGTTTTSPTHNQLGVSWSTVTAPGAGPTFTPPPQGPRVQSFGTEVAAGATTALNWPILKPGTYLLESGTHPSIQVPMGLYGILVVTAAPAGTTAGCAHPGATTGSCAATASYGAEVALELSEIDPIQNKAVQAAVTTVNFSETMVWSGQPGACGNPSSSTYHQCYPPTVNYTPIYYLINGVAFNKTNAADSLFSTSPVGTTTAPIAGNVLVRLVNAGLRMHVPSIVGSQTTGFNGAGTDTGGTPATTVGGFSIIAEDGNLLPGVPRVQTDVFMAAGKTFEVMVKAPTTPAGATAPPALPIYDRELSLSGNQVNRDSGMLAYIGINGGGPPLSSPALAAAVAVNDNYPALVAGQTLTVSDPAKGVIANDTNVFGVNLLTPAANGTVTLAANGTFTYVPTGTATSDSFTYCANGTVTAGVCSSGISATVKLAASNIVDSAGVTCTAQSFGSTMATYLAIKTPGVLAGCKDGANLPLTVVPSSVIPTGMTVLGDANGGFTATAPSAGTYTFTFRAKNSQGALSTPTTVTVVFPAGSGLTVTVLDGYSKQPIAPQDYRWIIEEDQTFYIDPKCSTNPPPLGCPSFGAGFVPTLGVNFHTSHMPFVAQGCTGKQSCEAGQTVYDPASGTHLPATCDIGNGVCRTDTTAANGFTQVMPSQVQLDPTKRYYISVLPGDAANPFYAATPNGHGMGGAPIAAGQTAVTVLSQPSPYPPAQLSVFVFEDDFPLNGEHDGGGGIDVLSPNEPGLGGFQIHLWDAMAGNGDFTGQMGFDMFNQPLTNSLAGTIDPVTQLDACPIGKSRTGTIPDPAHPGQTILDPTQTGITGMIVTCPKYEADGKTLSPLAGQAVVANLMPMRMGVIATPAADRIARGEEWLQTNTLDGQKAHDAFVRIGEPSYFQEYGPASYHVNIGFANPAIINGRHKYVCDQSDANITGQNCNNTLTGKVTGERLSRTPDERLYSSTTHDTYYWTQCFVSFGDPDGEDFAFSKCDADGNFKLTGLPDGDWRLTVFDQWNDLLVDGLSTPVRLSGGLSGATTNLGDISSTQWQTNLYTRTFIDDNKDGLSQASEAGIPFANVAVRLRDGSLENLIVTDFTGTANFNETFPLFSWYTVETDVTRYKSTGMHVVYDVGGPADGTLSTCPPPVGPTSGLASGAGYPPCGTSLIANKLANTVEQVSVPTNLRVPGAVYCAGADCTGKDMSGLVGSKTSDPPSACTTATTAPYATTCTTKLSSGRIDPPWMGVEGWQGFPGQNNFIEFGKAPYFPGENGGIKGHVVYASTRPFDDPQMLVQTQWTPLVPHVGINLYQEGFASDGVTPTLTLVDHTQTSSFDDWAQGFRADGVTPNMNCPGQGAATGANPDLFFFSLYNQPNYLNFYNSQHGGPALTALPNNSQFKCYDGMHNWNQIQPAPYDGMYQFPSVTAVDANGRPAATNCTICTPDPVPASGTDADPLRAGLPILPLGKYVVEVVLPAGFELVKEEDKNILIGDNYIAPVTQQFGALGSVFIVPDQASVAEYYNTGQGGYNGVGAAGYNPNSINNPTQSFGMAPANGIVPGFIPEPTWPCVGEARIVPDYISLFPQSKQVAPFAGATRNLCDRKEVTLSDQAGAIAKFFVYTSTHIASKFTGGITDDYTSEFDPFSPQFGEKFAPPDLPVSVKDWAGNEISRVYADHWGAYDGMTYSTWEVNPPNPTGYAPTMMVFCMNDPGPIPGPGGTMITDPAYTPGYSQFCYELPFMPGTTQYLDTPVVPTSAFAGAGYNNVDCNYPTLTPAVSEVDGDGVGPWIAGPGNGHPITIHALGDQTVTNYAYSGPAATAAPFNQKTITRHYGFGATQGTVTVGGIKAHIQSWSDTTIVATLVPGNVPLCAVQQQAQYGGSAAKCGQLVITTASGKQSIDAVTVTIGGKVPTHVAASATIQSAIDAAAPGDLIIVDPTCNTAAGPAACTATGITGKTTANHNELVLMWKPVRLQGVAAASTIINATTHPAGKLTPWRQQVNCLFGLAENGQPINTTPNSSGNPTNPFDPTGVAKCDNTNGWAYFTPYGASGDFNAQIDRLPFEATLGWDASLNGNLAELLQEPSLMGALEGAGITVLGKGVNFTANPFDPTLLAGFPTGTTLLSGTFADPSLYLVGDANPNCTSGTGGANPFPSNFSCNPSSIDGLTITQSSQGGGGIFAHGWNHNLQIANNRIYGNAGTLSGGINLGQGEFAPSYIQGGATNAAPGSCLTSGATGVVLPYCENLKTNIHNNYIALDSSTGDELFSATPAGAGGVSICTGSDYYKFNYNWVCGNLSSGDGGGIGHLGFIYNGDIEHNSILFNQSLNPTIPANGGGLLVMGTPDVDPTCGTTTDADCVATPGSVGPSDGMGPGLVINANLIMGNAAETGTGGGLRFQNVNGSEVIAFPTTPSQWYHAKVTNNIIANNVAGWDGAGVSLLDALNVDLVNNTIIDNSTTASAGILFTTIGAPLASAGGSNCMLSATTSCPQVAGLVSVQNSVSVTSNFPASITCPANHFAPGTSATNGTCRTYSYPLLDNNVFWQNSAYYIGVGALSAQFQQNVVSLYNAFTTTVAPSQPSTDATTANGNGVIITGGTGACVAANYWDIGARGDTGPGNHSSGVTLAPNYSVLTNTSENGLGTHNLLTINPTVVSQYCDGSRQPPEFMSSGFAVPPGISDATVPNPIFNLTPVATVDEGNNWINLRWGPLSLLNPVTNAVLGNYAPAAGSPVIDYIPSSADGANGAYTLAPSTDFFGNARKTDNHVDVGAVEFAGELVTPTLSGISPASGLRGATVAVAITGNNLAAVSAVNLGGNITCTISGTTATTVNASCVIATGAGLTTRAVTVTTPTRAATLPNAFTVLGPTVTAISPTSGERGTTVAVAITGTGLTGAGAVTIGGANITCTIVPPTLTATTVNASCVIAGAAALGTKTVRVTTPIGTTTGGADLFTVTGATVAISAPAPALNPTPANTTTKTGTVTVSNATGATGPFTFTAAPAVARTAGAGTFTITGGTCVSGFVVNPGGSCTILVQYVPGGTPATAPSTAHVTITGTGLAAATLNSANFNGN